LTALNARLSPQPLIAAGKRRSAADDNPAMSSTQSRAPRGERIVKQRQALLPAQNLVDHAANCSTFRWDDAARGLDGLPAGVLNIAYEAVDRHFGQGRGSRTAIR
jgi:hypothetical protein